MEINHISMVIVGMLILVPGVFVRIQEFIAVCWILLKAVDFSVMRILVSTVVTATQALQQTLLLVNAHQVSQVHCVSTLSVDVFLIKKMETAFMKTLFGFLIHPPISALPQLMDVLIRTQFFHLSHHVLHPAQEVLAVTELVQIQMI